MIYEKLNDISLYQFNKVLLGDYNALIIDGKHDSKELQYTADKLINEYYTILGSTKGKESCMMYEDAINNQRMLFIIQTLQYLKHIDKETTIQFAVQIGYSGDNIDDFLDKKEKYYSQRYELSKIAIDKYNKAHSQEYELSEKDLANERAALMMAGIPLDQHKISAMEYACLLRAKIEETKALKNKMKK